MSKIPRKTSDPIPLAAELIDIYSTQRLTREGARWDHLRKQFKERFDGDEALYIARAPGRVNLMGDHVDHMRFSCLPAALEMDILMIFSIETTAMDPSSNASSSSSSSLKDKEVLFRLENTDQSFQATSFTSHVDNHDRVQLDHSGPSRWANYFKVAFKGLLPHLPKDVLLESPNRPRKVNILVDGTIPPESSLSSSAAMTTCSSIVILQAFQARDFISRKEMAEVAIESERLVGVNSGGMDQAASIFGLAGSVLHVSFVPELSAVPIEIPPSDPPYTFVIANTLVKSDKKVMGPVQYNLRVGELKMACRALCRKLQLPQDGSSEVLKNLMESHFAREPLQEGKEEAAVQAAWDELGNEAAKMVKLQSIALSFLPSHPLKRSEVEELTGYKGEAFDKEFLSAFPIRADTFKLHARTKHVLAESLMVLRFKAQCSSSSQQIGQIYKQLGLIMHESQLSLFNDYENGCEELKKVCSIAEQSGALGSRPTGAGWGGSTVSLVEQGQVKRVLSALRQQYYDVKYPNMTDDDFADAVLVSQPAGGACLYKVQD